MSMAVAILGLAFLILIHEAGHFLTALAVGMRPRKFYIGFPPPLARLSRKGVEYGIGLIPLGGYVKIPGMYRPAGRDLARWFQRAEQEDEALRRRLAALAGTLDRSDYDTAQGEIEQLGAAIEAAELSPLARRPAEKGVEELRDGVGADAYWRQPAWKKIAVIFAGPGTNLVLAIILFAAVFLVGSGAYRLGFSLQPQGQDATRVVASVLPDHPAERAGLRAGDRIVAIDGRAVASGNRIPDIVGAAKGRSLTLTVLRDGRRVVLSPAQPARDEGDSAPQAVKKSFQVTGDVTKAIGLSLYHLVHGQGRKDISSPVGIVRGSEQALEQGVPEYLGVLGLISLSLALLNLLPLLPLDGGHIAFSAIEAVRRRAVPRAVYERASAVGIMLVLLLFLIGLSNDLGGGTGG
jgi:regulator of sigma E protease